MSRTLAQNSFMVTGSVEQSVDFITGLIEYAETAGSDTVEADPAAETAWMDHVAEVADGTLYRYAYKANSWYSGANVPGKKVVFMPYAGGVGTFQKILDDVAAEGYKGFTLSASRQPDSDGPSYRNPQAERTWTSSS